MSKYLVISCRGQGIDPGLVATESDLDKALTRAETQARQHNIPFEVYERVSCCTPQQSVTWEGKSPKPEPARVADREPQE